MSLARAKQRVFGTGVTCNQTSSFVVKNALLAFTKDALLCYTKYLGWSGGKAPDSRIGLRKHNLRLAGCFSGETGILSSHSVPPCIKVDGSAASQLPPSPPVFAVRAVALLGSTG